LAHRADQLQPAGPPLAVIDELDIYLEAESGFQKIAKDGFDKETASRLIMQSDRTDASFTIRFLAHRHIA